jgi:hypothetical protein
MEQAIEVSEGKTSIAWVTRAGSLEFLLLDPGGWPVVGALGRWFSPRDPDSWSDYEADWRSPDLEARSDGSGRVVFEVEQDIGLAVFLADGYRVERRPVGGPSSQPIRIYLRPIVESPRQLKVL